jgi:L-rhamnose isomerase
MDSEQRIESAYAISREQYAQVGVDVERAMETLRGIAISLHCWQGDDVGGFESAAGLTGGGIQATGNYPGKARNAEELLSDLDKALSLIPGKHRLNLHAIYADYGGRKIERDELRPESIGPDRAAWVWILIRRFFRIRRRRAGSRWPAGMRGFAGFGLIMELRAARLVRRLAEHLARPA